MVVHYLKTESKDFFSRLKLVYLLIGEDELINRVITNIVNILSATDSYCNVDRLSGEELEVNKLTVLREVPFISSKRVVIITDVDKTKKDIKSALLKYLENPCRSTCLILVKKEDSKSLKEPYITKSIDELIIKNGDIIKCFFTKEEELESFVKREIRKYGKEIDEVNISYLLHLIGDDLSLLSQEIKKLVLYKGEDKLITKEDIEKVVIPKEENNIFLLIDNIYNRRYTEAINILNNLLRSGVEEIFILSLIARQLRLILQTKLLIDYGFISKDSDFYTLKSEIENLPQEVKLKFPQKDNICVQKLFTIYKCVEVATKYESERLLYSLEKTLECDLSIKGIENSMDTKTALELLITKLCM